jgi:hypothetical protein
MSGIVILFDHGGFVIDENYLVQGVGDPTPLLGMTKPDQEFLAYHRSLWRLTSILTPENSRMIVTEWEDRYHSVSGSAAPRSSEQSS